MDVMVKSGDILPHSINLHVGKSISISICTFTDKL